MFNPDPVFNESYDPEGPHRPVQHVGLTVISGNDSRAEVALWIGNKEVIHREDNCYGSPPGKAESAFQRCVDWSLGHQHVARLAVASGLFNHDPI